MMWDDEREWRIQIFAVIVVAVMVILLGRVFYMQVLQGPKYKQFAEENRLRLIHTPAPRGIFYDRNGAVLVGNRPSFTLSILPSEYSRPHETTAFLAALTGMDPDEITSLLQKNQELSFTPVRIKRDLDPQTVAKIEERKADLPGVLIEALPVRQYVYGSLASHVFGYVGALSEDEYAARREQGYLPNDLIGKTGLERKFEDVIRGSDGGRQVEVNALGEELRSAGVKAPTPGSDLVLTLDGTLQKAAEEALMKQLDASRKAGFPAKGGALVALDVQTGQILVWASVPGYDPNAFATGISLKEWNWLLQDPNRPLTDRVIQNSYPPGSVFKIVTAAAALDKGLTRPDEIFWDQGYYVLQGWTFYGWETKGLGRLDLPGALAYSSDPVFYELGQRLGANTLADYALTFGYGQPTGVDFGSEEDTGNVPTEEWKQKVYGQSWYPGETLIAAIGQGYYLATLLQQAQVLMAVANGGIIYKPQLINKVQRMDGSIESQFTPQISRQIYLKPEHWSILRQGLRQVTAQGTAAAIFGDAAFSVAGKTGSAETGKGTTHSWFACYAPADKPEIAVAALMEEGGEGSTAAAPAVRQVLEAYFAQKMLKPFR